MPMDKPTADSRSVQSFAIIKTLDTRIFSLAVFKLELEMDYPSENNLCKVAPPPQTPLLRFFLRGGGRLYIGYLKRILAERINCPSKLTDKDRRIAHSKLKPFHSRRITYLMRITKRITHLTRIIRL